MARPKNTAERRHQIVLGLKQVMAEQGYDGASVPEIARAAGLAPGLVHYHFENKLEIAIELVHELGRELGARFERRAARATDAWSRLDAFIDAHVALGRDADPRAVACWVVLGAEALRRPELKAVYQRALRSRLEHARALVADVLELEARDVAEAPSIAASLLAAIEGAYQLSVAAALIPRGSAAPMIHRMARGLVARARQRPVEEVATCR